MSDLSLKLTDIADTGISSKDRVLTHGDTAKALMVRSTPSAVIRAPVAVSGSGDGPTIVLSRPAALGARSLGRSGDLIAGYELPRLHGVALLPHPRGLPARPEFVVQS